MNPLSHQNPGDFDAWCEFTKGEPYRLYTNSMYGCRTVTCSASNLIRSRTNSKLCAISYPYYLRSQIVAVKFTSLVYVYLSFYGGTVREQLYKPEVILKISAFKSSWLTTQGECDLVMYSLRPNISQWCMTLGVSIKFLLNPIVEPGILSKR